MASLFDDVKFTQVIEHLRGELTSLRSGRATPSLIEHVKVEAYGTLTPLVELASIAAPEPRTLVVSPWDKNIVKEVEKALLQANLGVTPTVDSSVVRLNFPQLTEERRRELVKMVNSKLEQARVGIRGVREDLLKSLKDKKTSGEIGEDTFFSTQKELQAAVDRCNDQIKQIGVDKEKEIMTI